MPNKNYLRGRRLEYEVVKELRKNNPNGFAQRMAGSHSPFDVIGFNPDAKTVTLVQCKTKVVSYFTVAAITDYLEQQGWKVISYRRTKFIKRKENA